MIWFLPQLTQRRKWRGQGLAVGAFSLLRARRIFQRCLYRRLHSRDLRLTRVTIVDRHDGDACIEIRLHARSRASNFVSCHPAAAVDEEQNRRWFRGFRLVEIKHLPLMCALGDVSVRGGDLRFDGVGGGFGFVVRFGGRIGGKDWSGGWCDLRVEEGQRRKQQGGEQCEDVFH